MVPTLRIAYFFYRFQGEKTDFCRIRHEVTGFFIAEVESVYCAVRTESLYKTDKVRLLRVKGWFKLIFSLFLT